MLDRWLARIHRAQVPQARCQGQGLVEYALILLLVAAVAIASLTALGADLIAALGGVAAQFP
jgi:Flp pilus assembly pilin Flp